MPFRPGPMGRGGARRRTRRRMMVVSASMLNRQQKQQIQQHTGKDPDTMSQEELSQAADELGIEPQGGQGGQPGGAPSRGEGSYTDELERLADLHAKGILTDKEFEAKKKQILGI